jgi:hypothetical protein
VATEILRARQRISFYPSGPRDGPPTGSRCLAVGFWQTSCQHADVTDLVTVPTSCHRRSRLCNDGDTSSRRLPSQSCDAAGRRPARRRSARAALPTLRPVISRWHRARDGARLACAQSRPEHDDRSSVRVERHSRYRSRIMATLQNLVLVQSGAFRHLRKMPPRGGSASAEAR